MPDQSTTDLWHAPKQAHTSERTSINATKLPASIRAIQWKPGTRNADIGGGRFDNVTQHLQGLGVENVIWDPYNRPQEHNQAAAGKLRGGQAHTATVNNVLNVIQEPHVRQHVIRLAADAIRPDGTAHFLIYEGDKQGTGGPTAAGWQEHRHAATYEPEIAQHFGVVKRRGNLIYASQPRKSEQYAAGQQDPWDAFERYAQQQPSRPDPTATKYAAYLAIHRTAGTTPRSFDDWRGEYERDQYAQNSREWVAVDLDGTLAKFDGNFSRWDIGEPVPAMLDRVKQWLAQGRDVRILTARVHGPDAEQQRRLIQDWCRKYIGRALPITNQKDPAMAELWDDRAIQVVRNTGQPVGRFSMADDEVNAAVKDWSPPTEAQQEAGNYAKPTISWKGLTIKIETPKGQRRKPEFPEMPCHYGYVAKVGGGAAPDARDGDKCDVFVGDELASDLVVVIDQETKSGRFDEWKAVIGTTNQQDAIDLYRKAYTPGWRVGPATSMTVEQFKAWLADMPSKRRIAEQVSRYAAKSPAPDPDLAPDALDQLAEQLLIDRYARKHLKSTAGQQSLHFESAAPVGKRAWTEEDERKHPRDETGEWAAKGEESKPAPKPDEPDQALQDHVANLHDAMQERLQAGKQFLARHAGKPLWISDGDHIRISDDKTTVEHTDPDGKWVRADLAQLDHWADKANIDPFTGPEGILTQKPAQDKATLPKERKDAAEYMGDRERPDRVPERPGTGDTEPGPDRGALRSQGPVPETQDVRPLAPGGREGPGDAGEVQSGSKPLTQEKPNDPAPDRAPDPQKQFDDGEQLGSDRGSDGDPVPGTDREGEGGTGREGGIDETDPPTGAGDQPGDLAGAGPSGQDVGAEPPAADQGDTDEPPADETQPEGPAGSNEPHEPLEPEVPEIDDSEPPEEYLAHERPNDLGERIQQGDAAAADEVVRRIDEQYPEGAQGPKADRARAIRKKLVEDFGEKIGGARKDMARPLGPRGDKKPDDDRPGWARRYSVGQIAKSMNKAEEGQWAVYDTKHKNWHGQPRQIGVFPTKEEADRSIPLAEVARTHMVTKTKQGNRDEAQSRAFVEAIEENARQISKLKEDNVGLLLNMGITDRFRKKAADGSMTQQRFDELKANGTIQSDADYAKAREIDEKIKSLQNATATAPVETGAEYAIVRKVSDRKHPVVRGGFKTNDEAMRYMAQHPEEIIEHQFPRYEQYQYLDHVQRQGGKPRAGNTTPQDFHQEFGFRGGEFGNWQSGRDGQEALNHTHDALRDLADILGVEPAGISLGGDLAIAFGARGTGGKDAARAHYEPGARVINLTKMRGAGTLAHEFAHAIDNYFARQAKIPGERYGKYEWVTEGLPYKHNLRPEVADAWTNLVKSLMGKEEVQAVDPERVQKQKQYHWDHVKSRIDNLEQSIKGDKRYNKRHKEFTPEQQAEWDATKAAILSGQAGEKQFVEGKSRFGGYQTYANLAKLNQLYKAATGRSFHTATKGSLGQDLYWSIQASLDAEKNLGEAQQGKTETKKRPTNYYNAARDLDETRASSYYTIPTEMLARAFEAYCYDKLGAQGRRSDYLVGKAENKYYQMFDMAPFPEGEERTAINAAFDRLFSTMQQRPREDEKGQHVELYRAEPLRAFAKELYAAYLTQSAQRGP